MATRRRFLRSASTLGISACLGSSDSLLQLSPATADEAAVTPDIVQLRPAIEPIVRLIEETPREKCFPMVLDQLRRGLPYRQFLAALFLAGIRNVNPQPPGFKFHCVFVIHSAHQLSLDASVDDRLLPLFWALDNFKVSQQKDVDEGDFRLRPVTGRLPSPEMAWQEFHSAMDEWDEPRADRAIVALARSKGAHEIIEGLWSYGARDYRNIGHKAIFVANSWRTLQTIGWQHAEPVLRSLVLGLLDFGKSERVNAYAFEDQAFLSNVRRTQQTIKDLPGNWTAAEVNPSATLDLLEAIRSGSLEEACGQTAAQLTAGSVDARAAWDAVHLAAGELMMRQPGIYGIHTVTSANGLRYAYQTSSDPQTRLLMLLQGVGWMCQFHKFMAGARTGLNDHRITAVEPRANPEDPLEAADQILAEVGKDPTSAASRAFAFAQTHAEPDLFTQRARQLVFRKGTDAHDYKYAGAIFEDYHLVSPVWRPHMLATAVYHLRGSSLPDSPVMQRAREAIELL